NGGYVAAFTGDGLKAYFGYPRASEHDPERAVRAGLALVKATQELETPPGVQLATRVGIATGDVVVGEMVGTGDVRERVVAGETPNLAARLQGLGDPNSVVIAEGTRQLLGSLFDYAELGSHTLKGFPNPVRAWRVIGENRTRNRFEATRTEARITPLIGREEE